MNDVVDEVKKLQQENAVPLRNIIVDSDGVGGGVTDYLRCQPFVNNAKPLKKENYQNIKTQCYYKLADLINTAQLQIIPKDNIKAILGRSPDYSDALAMRMYYEIDSNFGKYYVQ